MEDLGGFGAGCLFIPSLFMGFYSAKMYQAAVLEEIPMKQKSKKNNNGNGTQRKFKGDHPNGLTLSKDDIQCIKDETAQMQFMTSSWLKTMLCLGYCTKASRKTNRMKVKAIEHFESQLDIRTFVRMNIDLAIYRLLFFNKQQNILFNHHHYRAVTQYLESSDDANPEDHQFRMSLKHDYLRQSYVTEDGKNIKQLDHDNSKIDELLGFKIDQPIDLKLVMGLFMKMTEKQEKEEDPEERFQPFDENNANINLQMANE